MAEQSGATIEALFEERRSFPPPEEFRRRAVLTDPEVYKRAAADPEGYWASQAARLDWYSPWTTVLEWDLPYAKWFVGGTLNVSYNCLDRHVKAGQGERVAYHWEGEPGDTRTITYGDLLDDVCRCANALKELGVRRGDRVAIYLPMIPELPVIMLACARIGAPFTAVFAGFSATALSDRINDAEAKVLVTADGAYRRGKTVPLKDAADEALRITPSIEHVLVVRRT
ncbi:MAG: AMP-binding protein, partial [Chloroflexota bacterium]